MKKVGFHFVTIFLAVVSYMSAYADNTPPIARDDGFSTCYPQKFKAMNILANDSDPDEGDKLTSAIISGPFHGSLTPNSDGTYTYTPVTGYVGTDSFTYIVSDLSGAQSKATVSIYIEDCLNAGSIRINNLPVNKEIILNSNFWRDLTITTATGTFEQWHGVGIFPLTIKVYGQEIYKQLVTIEIGMTTTVNIPPSSLLSILAPSPCVVVENDLILNLCVTYCEKQYGFTMNYFSNPSDSAGFYWKMDVNTFRKLDTVPGNCISVSNDLKLDMCAEYQGHTYGFNMNFCQNPNDPVGLYWKMDVGTFKEIH